MRENDTHHEKKVKHNAKVLAMLIEVHVRQPRANCPIYTWDRERECMRLTGIYRAEPGLPADLASLELEGQLELPMLLLTSYSSAPGTLVQARLLGALSLISSGTKEDGVPSDGWVFVAAAEVDTSLSAYQSLEMLPPAQLGAFKAYVQAKMQDELQQTTGEIQSCDADAAARLLRETRLELKREQRARPRSKEWLRREEEEKPVAWRAIEGLSEELRAALISEKTLQADSNAPYLQVEQLIRFVPQRFQHALADLLLDDERLLAFVERPLLRHRTGWLGMQTWRSNEGLFLVTDRQVLWLRDFLAPGSNFLPGGYIVHMAPLERLQGIAILPAGRTPREFEDRLESKNSPYQRLVMEVASASGSELFVVEFPQKAELEKALARVNGILRAFLPNPEGGDDRRLRRLPLVEAWLPQGLEAERLAGLGGIVPAPIARQLEQRLASLVNVPGEELLVSAIVPALEDYKSPARWIALTRSKLLVLEDTGDKSLRSTGGRGEQTELLHCFDLTNISSAQLRHSLLGSSLSIFVPQSSGTALQHIFPFHSPAIAWFLPLFTRLRMLLSAPYRVN